MSAVRWVVLGFTAIGAYAAWRLVTNPPSSAAPTDSETPILKEAPAGTILVKAGGYYKGRIEGPTTATKAELAQSLAELGFTDLVLYGPAEGADVATLPALRDGAGASTRWFTGRWSKTTGHVPRPSWLVALIPTPRP